MTTTPPSTSTRPSVDARTKPSTERPTERPLQRPVQRPVQRPNTSPSITGGPFVDSVPGTDQRSTAKGGKGNGATSPIPWDDRRRAKLWRDTSQTTAQGVSRRDVIAAGGGAIAGSAISSQNLGGVKLAPTQGAVATTGNGIYIDNSTTVNYITNIQYANSCWNNAGYCQPVCGPGACWNSWGSSGLSIGIGFGTGNFSFGFFYGAHNAPLCSSWCDPWWNGWSGYVSVGCGPSWNWCRPCWSPCGGPWWSNYVVFGGYPSWSVPVYAYTPVYAVPSVTYVNYNSYDTFATPAPVVSEAPTYTAPPPSVVTRAPSAAIAVSVAESEAWDLLGNGFPRSAAESFARIHDANPSNARALAGYGVALAMLDDIPAAATVMREAAELDPLAVSALPLGPALTQRLQLLEQSAEVASRQSAMSRDALFALASWRAALGQYAEAHLAIVLAQQQGDSSAGAAALRGWLDSLLGPKA